MTQARPVRFLSSPAAAKLSERRTTMKKIPVLLTAALALVCTPLHAGQTDEETLRHFKTDLWPRAYRTQDPELLDTLLHPSFQMIDDQGNRSTKAGELAYVENNAWNPGNFKYTIERLDVYDGRFAVVDGTGTSDTYSYKSSNYLIKEDGRWQAIGSHVSGFKEKNTE
jgi:hypothetical protein